MSRKNKRAARRTRRRKCRLCRDDFSIHPHTIGLSQHRCQNCVEVEECARLLRADEHNLVTTTTIQDLVGSPTISEALKDYTTHEMAIHEIAIRSMVPKPEFFNSDRAIVG